MAEGAHRLNRLVISCNLLFLQRESEIPVARAADDHLIDEEEVIQGIEGVHAARASGDHDRASAASAAIMRRPAARNGPAVFSV